MGKVQKRELEEVDWKHNYLILYCLAGLKVDSGASGLSEDLAISKGKAGPRSLMEKKADEALESEEFEGGPSKWTEQELEVIEPKTRYYIDRFSGMNSNSGEIKLKLNFLIKNGYVEKLVVGSKTKYKITLSGFRNLYWYMMIYKSEKKGQGK